jgi:hypothetical protein
MQTVGAYEAKTHLTQLLERVAKGERITITKHGVPVGGRGVRAEIALRQCRPIIYTPDENLPESDEMNDPDAPLPGYRIAPLSSPYHIMTGGPQPLDHSAPCASIQEDLHVPVPTRRGSTLS